MVMVVIPGALASAGNIAAINVGEVQSINSTWAWRVAGYEEATARLLDSGPVDMLIGPPAGWAADLTATSFSSTIIHSRYIEVLAYYGILGCAVLLLWLGMLAKRIGRTTRLLRGRPARNHAQAHFLEALLLSEIVYMIPYTGGILQSAVLGLIWVAATQNQRSFGAHRVAFVQYQFDRRNKPAIWAI
jgi:O-antigen ligase